MLQIYSDDPYQRMGGVPADVLDGKNHPCPKCGGMDRFRMIEAAAGALFCNQCFNKGNGDGIAALKWLRGGTFPETVNALAEYLGQSSDQPSKPAHHNGKPKIVASYDYRDEQGKLLYQVQRKEPGPDGKKDVPATAADRQREVGLPYRR